MNEQNLPSPIEVAKFWANRRGEAAIVTLREYEGAIVIDVCRQYSAADGTEATRKGITLTINKLPDLATAINKAVTKARELGLIRSAS